MNYSYFKWKSRIIFTNAIIDSYVKATGKL